MPPDAEGSDAARIGHYAEAVLHAEWEHRTGVKLRIPRTTRRCREHEWMLANVDRQILGIREGVEFKTRWSADGWGPDGGGPDDIPIDVLLQVQHYLAVTRWRRFHVFAWFFGTDFRAYTVEPDPDLIASIIDEEAEFWGRVQRGEPPEFDLEHPSTLALLHALHPQDAHNGLALHVGADAPDDLESWRAVHESAREHRRRYQQTIDHARAHIEHAMGDHRQLIFPDGASYVRKNGQIFFNKPTRYSRGSQ